MTRTQLYLALIVGLVGTLATSAPAVAGPSPHMMTGDWQGFFQSPGTRGMASLQVLSQDGRRFMGMFSAGGLNCNC